MTVENGRDQGKFAEAVRYLKNANGLARRAPVRDRVYQDLKPVREACGTAWLAVLEAADGALLKRNMHPKQLPKSYEGYVRALATHLAVKNGRLLHLFRATYDELHIAGHYRGLLTSVGAVQDAFTLARQLIEKLSGQKIA